MKLIDIAIKLAGKIKEIRKIAENSRNYYCENYSFFNPLGRNQAVKEGDVVEGPAGAVTGPAILMPPAPAPLG